jgi:cytochrome c
VTLTVRSRSGRMSFPTVTRIFVGNSAPEPTIVSPPEGTVLVEGRQTRLQGFAIDAQEGELACSKLVWDVRLIHNSHAHPVLELSGCRPTFEPSLLDHDAGPNNFLAVELRATDRGGPGDENALTGSALRLFEVEPAG